MCLSPSCTYLFGSPIGLWKPLSTTVTVVSIVPHAASWVVLWGDNSTTYSFSDPLITSLEADPYKKVGCVIAQTTSSKFSVALPKVWVPEYFTLTSSAPLTVSLLLPCVSQEEYVDKELPSMRKVSAVVRHLVESSAENLVNVRSLVGSDWLNTTNFCSAVIGMQEYSWISIWAKLCKDVSKSDVYRA